MTRKKKRSKAARKAELAAYDEMMRRIERGEVRRLVWKSRGQSFPVQVMAERIYLTEPGPYGHGQATRVITPGALARSFEDIPKDDHWATD